MTHRVGYALIPYILRHIATCCDFFAPFCDMLEAKKVDQDMLQLQSGRKSKPWHFC